MIVVENVRVLHFHPGYVSGPRDIAIHGGKIVEVGLGLAAKHAGAERLSPGG